MLVKEMIPIVHKLIQNEASVILILQPGKNMRKNKTTIW